MSARWWWLTNLQERSNRAAFEYELRMRKSGRKRFKTYVQLGEIAQLHLKMNAVIKTPDSSLWMFGDMEPGEGWSPYLRISWNLTAPTKTLAREFAKLVTLHRKQRGIRVTLPPRKKNPAWRALELFDRKAAGEILGESERSQLSKWFRV